MSQDSVVTSPTAASRGAAPSTSPSLVCTWKEDCYGAAWIQLAGELDLATSLQLRYAVAEAQLHAFLLVLDLRELTFMDCVGMQVILDAVGGAQAEGDQVVLVRGPAQVDNVFKVSGACKKITIIDLPPTEPEPALFDLVRASAAA
jgi:anti-anti-sigma factor